MIQLFLTLIQPLAVIIFLSAGVLCLLTKQWLQGIINLSIANANFWIFFGKEIFK